MLTIQITGGNLFQLAAQYLGDATQWIRIAQQNGLIDPQIIGQMTLVIPDIDPTATGGIPQQS